jgi:predicted small lipoprotein YifL
MRKLVLLMLMTIATLSACGVKGPLYLPEQMYPQPKEKPKTAPETAPAETAAPAESEPSKATPQEK